MQTTVLELKIFNKMTVFGGWMGNQAFPDIVMLKESLLLIWYEKPLLEYYRRVFLNTFHNPFIYLSNVYVFYNQ